MTTTITVPKWPIRTGPKQWPDRFLFHAMGEFIKNPETGQVLYAPHWIEFLKLSVHVFVTPDARIIESFSPLIKGAHAAPFNSGSVGLEFLVPGVHQRPSLRAAMLKPDCITMAQLGAAAAWCWNKGEEHSISRWSTHHILVPKRKVDPWLPDHPSQAKFENLMNAGGITYASQ